MQAAKAAVAGLENQAQAHEAYWRSKISAEIYEFGEQMLREADNRGVGAAAHAIAQEIGNRVGKMPY